MRSTTGLALARQALKTALGVRLNGDVAERLCDLGIRPPVGPRRRRRLELLGRRGLLFIHVPKAAGMAVSEALFGEQVQHASVRYYRAVAPGLTAALPSLAVVREPFERFCSAYAYARAAGSRDNRVSEPFRAAYLAFRDVDDALDHLERADWPYGVDHIFRPQSWYVTDGRGTIAVDHLISLPDLDAALAQLAPWAPPLSKVNRSAIEKPILTSRQAWRLRYLYAADFQLAEVARASTQSLLRRRATPNG